MARVSMRDVTVVERPSAVVSKWIAVLKVKISRIRGGRFVDALSQGLDAKSIEREPLLIVTDST